MYLGHGIFHPVGEAVIVLRIIVLGEVLSSQVEEKNSEKKLGAHLYRSTRFFYSKTSFCLRRERAQ